MCSAVSTVSIATPTTLYFNAQGTFAQSKTAKKKVFRDVTNDASAAWFPVGDLTQIAKGIYSVPAPNGCGSLSMQDGGLISQTVEVTVGSPATPCPTP
jgi:hypothetical protein